MGRPWQSHPGRKRTLRPCSIWYLVPGATLSRGQKNRMQRLFRCRPVDEVLENLVHRMANVEISVRIWWAVMQGEWLPGVVLHQGLVDIHVLPQLLDLWLSLDRVSPEIEVGLRQTDCILVVAGFLLLALRLLLWLLCPCHDASPARDDGLLVPEGWDGRKAAPARLGNHWSLAMASKPQQVEVKHALSRGAVCLGFVDGSTLVVPHQLDSREAKGGGSGVDLRGGIARPAPFSQGPILFLSIVSDMERRRPASVSRGQACEQEAYARLRSSAAPAPETEVS